MLDSLSSYCENYVFGDAMHRYTWEKAGLDDARLVMSSIDQQHVSDRILEFETDVDVVLRANDAVDVRALLDRGALYVAVPDVLASDQLIEHVTEVINNPQSSPQLESSHRVE